MQLPGRSPWVGLGYEPDDRSGGQEWQAVITGVQLLRAEQAVAASRPSVVAIRRARRDDACRGLRRTA